MRNFYSAYDVDDLDHLVSIAKQIKQDPVGFSQIGQGKLLVLLFFNASLRTKISTQKAALNLGMQVITMDMKDSWNWEMEDGRVMKFDTAEHIKEAAAVIGRYADVVGIRSFPGLKQKDIDYQDLLLQKYIKYSPVPVVNLESSIRHPLQSFADLTTIRERFDQDNIKVVLTWAPHPKSLPQAVSNSFLEWMHASSIEVTITHPKGYTLDEQFTKGHQVVYDQDEALKNADVVYVKNWSSTNPYGKVLESSDRWKITAEKLQNTNSAKLMHCLPVRRNVVISDDAMDSEHSIIYDQAENRVHTAQAVLYSLLS